MKVLFAEETNTSVSVTFDNYPVRGKSRQVQSPMCIVKCGEETEIFSYCGTQELVAKLCGKIQKGQLFELSIYEYSSARDVARVLVPSTARTYLRLSGDLEESVARIRMYWATVRLIDLHFTLLRRQEHAIDTIASEKNGSSCNRNRRYAIRRRMYSTTTFPERHVSVILCLKSTS